PAQVKAWVQRARTGVPDIKDAGCFAKEWAAWWQDINPLWWKSSNPMPKTDGDWTVMDLSGQNGFLNVLIFLKWWRERLKDEFPEWVEAVADVTWVLQKMNR
ncbi:hypothetical protein K438DRAFT_1581800, partial [Mycena galopus ATCC 62051]